MLCCYAYATARRHAINCCATLLPMLIDFRWLPLRHDYHATMRPPTSLPLRLGYYTLLYATRYYHIDRTVDMRVMRRWRVTLRALYMPILLRDKSALMSLRLFSMPPRDDAIIDTRRGARRCFATFAICRLFAASYYAMLLRARCRYFSMPH